MIMWNLCDMLLDITDIYTTKDDYNTTINVAAQSIEEPNVKFVFYKSCYINDELQHTMAGIIGDELKCKYTKLKK